MHSEKNYVLAKHICSLTVSHFLLIRPQALLDVNSTVVPVYKLRKSESGGDMTCKKVVGSEFKWFNSRVYAPNHSFPMEGLEENFELERGIESDFFFFLNGDHSGRIENKLELRGDWWPGDIILVSVSDCTFISSQTECYILVCHDIKNYLILVKLKDL